MSLPTVCRATALLLALAAGAMGADTTSLDTRVREIIARAQGTPLLVRDLDALIDGGTPAEAVAILAAIGRSGAGAAAPAAAEAVAHDDPRVAVAAIAAVTALWPTRIEDAEAVRAAIASPRPEVARAAIAFARAVGDDGALAPMITRLGDADPVRGEARAALVDLGGVDVGSDAAAWRAWADERQSRLDQGTERARKALAGEDATAASAALMSLLAVRHARVAVGEILVDAAGHRDAAIATLARNGLVNTGGPVCDCAMATLGQHGESARPPVEPPQLAAVPPPETRRPWFTLSGVLVVLVVGIAALVGARRLVRAEQRRQAEAEARDRASRDDEAPSRIRRTAHKITFVLTTRVWRNKKKGSQATG